MVTNPTPGEESAECQRWLLTVVDAGHRVRVPEIADYEVRRELLRLGRIRSLARLDQLGDALGYLPITTPAMRKAAENWAELRRAGLPTAPPLALDADAILCAQAQLAEAMGEHAVIATTNVGHLSRLAAALHWRDIR
jgi:predicted nucleic acid-binding protein